MINPPRGKQENALSDYWWINEHKLREVGGVVCWSVCVCDRWGMQNWKGQGSRGRGGWWAQVKRWDEIDGSWTREQRRCLKGGGVRRRKGGQIRFNNRRCQSGETAGTYDLSPAFSRVSSSRLLDLLTVCRTWSTTSDPWRQIERKKTAELWL